MRLATFGEEERQIYRQTSVSFVFVLLAKDDRYAQINASFLAQVRLFPGPTVSGNIWWGEGAEKEKVVQLYVAKS